MPYSREDVTIGRLPSGFESWFSPPERIEGERRVRVTASADGLALGDRRVGAAELGPVRIDLGADIRVVVEVEKRSTIAIVCPDLADARALVAALGRRPERTATRFRTDRVAGKREVLRSATTLGAALLVFAAGAGFWVMSKQVGMARVLGEIAMVSAMAAAALVATAVRRNVTELGIDGLRVLWLWTTYFVPWSDVARVTQVQDGVVLGLGDGYLSFAPHAAERVGDIAARIEETRAAARTPSDSEDLRLLDLDGPIGNASVAALRELGKERSTTYRAPRMERDRLWRIVEDPSQLGATRARAAVALSGELDVPQKQRLRVAASATASPKVRVVLDRLVAGAHDQDVASALAALDGPTERSSDTHRA